MAACGPSSKQLEGEYVERGRLGVTVFHGGTVKSYDENGKLTGTMQYSVSGNKVKIIGSPVELTIIDDKTIGSPIGYLDKK